MQISLPALPIPRRAPVAILECMKTPFDFSQKNVLVTGASMGIGEVFARELARRGAKVVLIARSRDRLEKLARELPGAEFLVEDLAAPGAARRVFEAVSARGLLPDLLVNNAGFGTHGRFDELALDIQREAIDLNVGALVELTHLCLPALEQRQGGVINIASTAAFQPVPYMAVYAATKAFVLSFSEALWASTGRAACACWRCARALPTRRSSPAPARPRPSGKASSEDVVRLGLKAFDDNRASVVHGCANYLTALAGALSRASSWPGSRRA